jgi:hypothetical protein
MEVIRTMKPSGLRAGAAQADFTPDRSLFLWGYPHVPRLSTGTHDPLLSSALFLSDGRTDVLFIANDILFIPKSLSKRARDRISTATGIPASHILISATHTHSGPITIDLLASESDPVVPKADPLFLLRMEEAIVSAATKAHAAAVQAEVGSTLADATGIGTNRHRTDGPADLSVPFLAVRSAESQQMIALMLVCCMHPTVLHEDSTLFSGDFPGLARLRLQADGRIGGVPVLHHTGPSGNQSPRHVTRGNTFTEAARLGDILASAILRVLPDVRYSRDERIEVRRAEVTLPARVFESVADAVRKRDAAVHRFGQLKSSRASRQEIRTAECDVFGAEENVSLATAAADGRLEKIMEETLPAEIQVFRIGERCFAAWPGECFVEYGRAVKNRHPEAAVISLANGELQGYIATPEAVRAGAYEAANAVFAPEAGEVLVRQTLRLLEADYGSGPGH